MFGVGTKPKTLPALWWKRIGDCAQSVRWSPDGALLAVAEVSGPIHVYDAALGLEIVSLPGHRFGTTKLAWRPQGRATLASAGQDGTVLLHDLERPGTSQTLDGGAEWVEQLAWSPRGDFLATGAGRKLRLWSADGELLRSYPDHGSTVADLAWTPPTKGQSDQLATASYGMVKFFAPDAAEPTRQFEWKGSMLRLAWSPDGKALATGNQDSTVHFWFVDTGKDLQMWGYPSKIRELAWDSKSRFLATGGSSTVTIWDCSGKGPANTKPLLGEFHERLISQLAAQHDRSLLASGCEGGIVAIWNPYKAEKGVMTPWAVEYHDSPISQLEWSPKDQCLAVGEENGAVRVYAAP
jgi:WD40 repeat protein